MTDKLNDIKNKATKIAKDVKVKTKTFAKSTKLSIELKMEEANLDACFEKLGRAYYLNVSCGYENDEKIEKLVKEADEISAKIADYKKKIAEIGDKWICKHCSSVVNGTKPYCSNCGQKIVANEKKTEDASPVTEETVDTEE